MNTNQQQHPSVIGSVVLPKKVIDCRVDDKGQQYYKVKWLPSWEPAERLQQHQHLVDAFWLFVNNADHINVDARTRAHDGGEDGGSTSAKQQQMMEERMKLQQKEMEQQLEHQQQQQQQHRQQQQQQQQQQPTKQKTPRKQQTKQQQKETMPQVTSQPSQLPQPSPIQQYPDATAQKSEEVLSTKDMVSDNMKNTINQSAQRPSNLPINSPIVSDYLISRQSPSVPHPQQQQQQQQQQHDLFGTPVKTTQISNSPFKSPLASPLVATPKREEHYLPHMPVHMSSLIGPLNIPHSPTMLDSKVLTPTKQEHNLMFPRG